MDKTLDAGFFIIIFSPHMYLYLMCCIQMHQVQNLGMITKFMNTATEYLMIRGIDEGELVRMHRDTYLMRGDNITQGRKGILEMGLPWKSTDRMGGKGDKIRGDTKKQEIMGHIKF
jgi:hypothetical protein